MPLTDAQLTYQPDPGCAPGGQMAYLQNKLPNRAISVTLEIATTITGNTTVGDSVITLAGWRKEACELYARRSDATLHQSTVQDRRRSMNVGVARFMRRTGWPQPILLLPPQRIADGGRTNRYEEYRGVRL
jgi:hypothetical protein